MAVVALTVPEQPSDRGQPDAVHDALRGPSVARVVDAKPGQSRLLADDAPEGVEPVRC